MDEITQYRPALPQTRSDREKKLEKAIMDAIKQIHCLDNYQDLLIIKGILLDSLNDG